MSDTETISSLLHFTNSQTQVGKHQELGNYENSIHMFSQLRTLESKRNPYTIIAVFECQVVIRRPNLK